jgi:hypothetical protein
MKTSLNSTVCALLLTQLAGCTSLTTMQTSRQQQIESRYAQATKVYKQKITPFAQYFVKTCGPMEDREYLDCINAKRSEIAALSIYPESAEAKIERQILETRLLDKQIDRKQFRAQLEALKAGYDAKQLQCDIDNGEYTGGY